VKNKIFVVFLLFLLISLVLPYSLERNNSYADAPDGSKMMLSPQTVPKPEYDYMSTILSRNTKPLGLKENPTLQRYLAQPTIKWAIRSEKKHILN
jgi:hypothetical protein